MRSNRTVAIVALSLCLLGAAVLAASAVADYTSSDYYASGYYTPTQGADSQTMAPASHATALAQLVRAATT